MILFFDSTYWTYELITVIAVIIIALLVIKYRQQNLTKPTLVFNSQLIIIAYDLLAVIIDIITFNVKTESKKEQ